VVHANARLTPAGRPTVSQGIAAGRPVAHVAAEMGTSRTCAYRWWARYQQLGQPGLVDRPSTAHSHPLGVPDAVQAEIARLRRTRKLGPARIAVLVGRAASTGHRVLVRLGLNRLAWMDRPTERLVRRYERAAAGELLHYVHAAVDDHTRMWPTPRSRPTRNAPRRWTAGCTSTTITGPTPRSAGTHPSAASTTPLARTRR
jgi:hypothetical protein